MDYSRYFRFEPSVVDAKQRVVGLYSGAPWMARVYREVVRLPAGASVLDIGSGEGHFLETCRRIRPDLNLAACDLERNIVWPSLEGIAFFRKDLDSGSGEEPPSGQYDFVNCQHVVEHLEHPDTVFSLAMTALKPGGLLYVEAPDVRLTYVPHVPFLTGRRGQLTFWDDPTHRRPFTRAALRRLADMHGFEVEDSFYARRYGHLLALPAALLTFNDDYKLAVLQAIFGLFCAVTARKPRTTRG